MEPRQTAGARFGGTDAAGSLSCDRGECSAGVAEKGVRDVSPRSGARRVPWFDEESASGGQELRPWTRVAVGGWD